MNKKQKKNARIKVKCKYFGNNFVVKLFIFVPFKNSPKDKDQNNVRFRYCQNLSY